jgi:hypothetical protein
MNQIKVGTKINHLTPDELKKIRLSVDPDEMGFEDDNETEGVESE